MKYKNYIKYIVTTISVVISTSFFINWKYFNFESIEGDLTRIGMHSEANYGNNGAEYFFKPPLSSKGTIDSIDVYDIAVVGDSFSNHMFSRAWHNYLQRETGLKIGVYKMDDLNKIKTSSKYKESPPKVIIYESIERELNNRHFNKVSKENCTSSQNKISKIKLKLNPLNIKPYLIKRNTDFSFKIDLGIKFLREKIKDSSKQKTKILDLITPNLFTNKNSDKLLIYKDDIESKKNLSLQDWKKVRCGLLVLQREIQQNKKTKFITLIAPDKLTVYSTYLKNKQWKNISQYQYLTNDHRLNIVPLLQYFENSLQEGQKDLYLPNDTHWGSSGNMIVGQAVLDYLHTIGLVSD